MADEMRTYGSAVHAFAAAMQNLGLPRQVDQVVSLFESGYWREFRDGLGLYRFLPGEFDYFLTQWGVDRATVMTFPIDVKVRLQAAMDERRTGEEGYRRSLEEARASNPGRPDPIDGFGYTQRQAKAQEGAGEIVRRRPALGATVRRVADGKPKPRRSPRTLIDRVRHQLPQLSSADLDSLYASISAERRRRTRR